MTNQNGFDSDEQEAYEYNLWQQRQQDESDAQEAYEAMIAEQESSDE